MIIALDQLYEFEVEVKLGKYEETYTVHGNIRIETCEKEDAIDGGRHDRLYPAQYTPVKFDFEINDIITFNNGNNYIEVYYSGEEKDLEGLFLGETRKKILDAIDWRDIEEKIYFSMEG